MLTLTPRALTITPDALARLYGDANSASGGARADNPVNGDTIATVALASPAGTASPVGAYALSGSAASGTGLANYTIRYATVADGLTVVARPLTLAAIAQARPYGDSNPALAYTIGGQGLVNGDTLSGALATGATSASGIGGYAIAQGSLAASANYKVTYAGALLTITPRALSIIADDQARLYGETNPALIYRIAAFGLVNGDTLAGALTTSATRSSDPGVYAITQGSLAASVNYAVRYTPALFTIGAALVAPSSALGSSVVRDGFATGTAPKDDGSTLGGTSDALLPASTIESVVCPRDQGCGVAAGAH